MSRCGIDIRGRSRKLYLNYRTTEEIRRQAVSLLEGCEIDDLDEGTTRTAATSRSRTGRHRWRSQLRASRPLRPTP